MTKKIFIKRKTRRKEEFQFFMHDFVDACRETGMGSKADLFPTYKWHIRAVFRELLLRVYGFVHEHCPRLLRRREALIVTANGVSLKDNAFPYYGSYEIVPMLWDVWPSTWERMYASFQLLDVRTVLVTSSQVAEMINRETDIKAFWVPEGIDGTQYHKGADLAERHTDVMEMGRQLTRYHEVLTAMAAKGEIHGYVTSNINSDGTLDDRHVAYTNEELHRLMADSKVMVCFPQCDTNPARGGNIDTLTMRYWEAMLSCCVMIGRCPKELNTLIGYNPVIDVDWQNPKKQLQDILLQPHVYQALVNKNLRTAEAFASWAHRMPNIKKILSQEGYII